MEGHAGQALCLFCQTFVLTSMKKYKNIIIPSFIAMLVFTWGCEEEHKPVITYQEADGLFICNEGNFTYGNASLSFFNTETNEVNQQVFYNANDFPLGDVCQSMSIVDTFGYLLMNNSGKIFVISTNTFKHLHTISGLTSPRYMGFISPTKAYVTDLYSPDITIINPATNQVTGTIHIGKGTEQLVVWGNHAFVTGWSYNNQVYRIDNNTDQLVDSVAVAKQPNSIVLDKNNKLWVLSDGGFEGSPYGQEKPAITRIDAASFTVEKVFEFPEINYSPSRLCINGARDTLYYINGGWGSGGLPENGIFCMPVTSTALPSEPLIPENNRLFYGLTVDPEKPIVYASDAIDYMQSGLVFRFTSTGEKIDSFRVGVSPGSFCFKP